MKTEQKGKFIILTADEGYVLTNGDIYSIIVYLGKNDKIERWYETLEPEEENNEEE